MPTRIRWACAAVAGLAGCGTACALSLVAPSLEEHVRQASAIGRGTVVRLETGRDATGSFLTRAHVRVTESIKGRFPAVVVIVQHGGSEHGAGMVDSSAPRLAVGEERVFFLDRRRDGTLEASAGESSAPRWRRGQAPDLAWLAGVRRSVLAAGGSGADVSDQAGTDDSSVAEVPAVAPAPAETTAFTGLAIDNYGLPVRFIGPDRGEPIRYLVDAQALPAGLTLTQALDAVKAAANAWTAVTGVKFAFEGLQNFGLAVPLLNVQDGKLRLQLHDLYGYIVSPNTLGRGGWYFQHYLGPPGAPAVSWANGGNVAGNEFDLNVAGWALIKHTHPDMSVLSSFTEVLAHEIGHALGLAHSSENMAETNSLLREAIMYYAAHRDGRGATLGAYDPPIVRQAYPPSNTPPYSASRNLEIVTVPAGALNVPGINEVELRGYDRQDTNLSLVTTNMRLQSGSFGLAGNRLRFTPGGFFNTPRLDPGGTSFYDLLAFRFSDGSNGSPIQVVRVIWHQADNYPLSGPDGMPDEWMTAHWGSPDPAAGPNRSAGADADGDGFSNLQEFLLGTRPVSAASRFRITVAGRGALAFTAKPYEVYELYASTNLATWRLASAPLVPATTNGMITAPTNAGVSREFFRMRKVP